MSAPLSKVQKRYLSQLAERAFDHQNGRADLPVRLPRVEQLSQYRHAEVARASGKIGLRCCDQNDYKLVEAHFLELLGHHGAAFNAQLRAATETRRLISHKIMDACSQFGLRLAYAEAICRKQNHGRGLDEVDERTLWRIFYTIRNRGLARKKNAPLTPYEP